MQLWQNTRRAPACAKVALSQGIRLFARGTYKFKMMAMLIPTLDVSSMNKPGVNASDYSAVIFSKQKAEASRAGPHAADEQPIIIILIALMRLTAELGAHHHVSWLTVSEAPVQLALSSLLEPGM